MEVEVRRLREPHQRHGDVVLKTIWEVLPFAVKDCVDRVHKEKENQVVHLKWPVKLACLCKPRCVCWLLGRTISVSGLPAVLLAGCSLHWPSAGMSTLPHWPSAGMSTLSHWPSTGNTCWSSYLTECRYKFLLLATGHLLLTVERILDFGYSRISDLTRSVLKIALELVAVSLSTETVLIKADLHTCTTHEKDNTYMRISANTSAFEWSFLVQPYVMTRWFW